MRDDADQVGYVGGEQWRTADPALVPHLLDQTRARNAEHRRLAYHALQSMIRHTGDAAASQALVAMARGTPARADARHLLAALEEVTEPVVLTGTAPALVAREA